MMTNDKDEDPYHYLCESPLRANSNIIPKIHSNHVKSLSDENMINLEHGIDRNFVINPV